MLPLSLLKTAQNHPMLVELKNGETYNGHLVSCDNWMNINLREVICTSRDGDKFWRMPECYIRGSTIKYLRIPDEIIDMVKEEVMSKGRGRGGMQQQKQMKGRGAGGAGRGVFGGRGRGVPGGGDAGYGVLPWLMTPVRFPRTPAQRRYNRAHRKTRNVIERLFGVLKSRFRCLSVTGGALLYSPIKVSEIIVVCAMLHNVAMDHGLGADINDALEPEIEGYVGRRMDNQPQGRRVRDQLIASHFSCKLSISFT
uniref:U6 snRNA-associated Sm-like protein LSm4 n=1 Tax=Xenopus tropicalis TaxID=8364 RepID=A0A803KA99_XENTR